MHMKHFFASKFKEYIKNNISRLDIYSDQLLMNIGHAHVCGKASASELVENEITRNVSSLLRPEMWIMNK